MKQIIGSIFLTSTLVFMACQSEQAGMESFSSEVGQFTISTPAPFEETHQSVETPVGPVDIYTFTAETEESAYVVAFSDYPAQIVEQSEPNQLLDSSRDGAVTNLGGTLVSESEIEIGGNPGRSLVITTDTGTNEPAMINSRIYLVNNRLYQILVVSPQNQDLNATSEAFLKSFSLNQVK